MEYYESFWDKLGHYFLYFFLLAFAACPFLVYFDPHRDWRYTGEEFYLLFILTPFALWMMYRNATERRLQMVATPFDQATNRAMLTEYLRKKGYDRQRSSYNILVYTEQDYSINPHDKKLRIFLLQDNKIYFAMLREHTKADFPVLFSHLFLERDLKKLFRQ